MGKPGSATQRVTPALRSTWLSLRHEMRRKWKFLFRDAINAEGSLLIQQLYWSFWTFQLQITGSYILSQPPNWHLNTCDIYTYTPQLFLPDCLSSHLLPFLFFSSPHLHSAVVPLHPSLLTLLLAKTPAFHFGSVLKKRKKNSLAIPPSTQPCTLCVSLSSSALFCNH